MITVPVSLQCRGCRPAVSSFGAWIIVPARIRFFLAGSTSQGSVLPEDCFPLSYTQLGPLCFQHDPVQL